MSTTPPALFPSTQASPRDEAEERLMAGGLRIKFGVDPTSPNLHLGHAVALRQLRSLQEAGHTVLLVLGNFTAAIGDPTGRNTTRPPLSQEEINANAQTYLEQAFLILDPEKTEVVRNGDWLGAMSAAEVIRLAASTTVAQMSQRNDFAARLADQTPISLHEFLYPLFQGQDSVHLACDAELGGTDQTFNLMMGRSLQVQAGQRPQFVMTVPLLVGLDGQKKMSKSYGNEVGLLDSPVEKFSKIMQLPDSMVCEWGALLTGETQEAWKGWMSKDNPRDVKFRLARTIVSWLHGEDQAMASGETWQMAVQQRRATGELPIHEVEVADRSLSVLDLLVQVGLCPSKTVARQKVQEGGVRLDGKRISEPQIPLLGELDGLLQVGKKNFRRVRLRPV